LQNQCSLARALLLTNAMGRGSMITNESSALIVVRRET
jgi:hypothetical protein